MRGRVIQHTAYKILNTGWFFQVGESIKASNVDYDILGWTKVNLWLESTWHLVFEREKIFLTNFVSIFIKTKISGKSIFFIPLFMWTKLKLQNPSEKLFWIKTKVKISKSVIKIQLFEQKKIFLCIIQKFIILKKWSELNRLIMVNYAKLKSKLVQIIFSLLNIKCQVVCNHKLTLVYLKIA